MFLDLNKITKIIIEPSSWCNLHCPQCPRFDEHGFLDKNLNKGHLDFSSIEQNLQLSHLPNLRHIKIEGDYGDPAMHPDLLRFVAYFGELERVQIVTNGSIRSPNWFKELARYKNVDVDFSIDGLQDTNHIYRINADWQKIMDNAKAFINAGGNAIWKMIVFKHNQHQVEQARQVSQDLGFTDFKIIYSDRNFYNSIWPVYIDGTYQYDLEISDDLKLATKAHIQANSVNNFESPTCKWVEQGKFYINYLGFLLPCCMTSGTTWKNTISDRLFRKILGNTDDISLVKHDVRTIALSDFYRYRLQDSFASIKTCHNICSKYCS